MEKLDWRALVDLEDLMDLDSIDLDELDKALEDLRAVVDAEDCSLDELMADWLEDFEDWILDWLDDWIVDCDELDACWMLDDRLNAELLCEQWRTISQQNDDITDVA